MNAVMLAFALILGHLGAAAHAAGLHSEPIYEMRPIGWVRKSEGRTFIEVDPAYQPALLGVADLSSIWVLYWYD